MRRRKWLWAAVIVVVIAGTGWAAWVLTGPRTYLPPGTERITTTPNNELYDFSLTPDGRRAAFFRPQRVTGEDYYDVLDLADGRVTPLEAAEPSSRKAFAIWLDDETFAQLVEGNDSVTLVTHSQSRVRRQALIGIGHVWAVAVKPESKELYLADYLDTRPLSFQNRLWRISLATGSRTFVEGVHPGRFMIRAPDDSRWLIEQMEGPNQGFFIFTGDFRLDEALPTFRPRGARLYPTRVSFAPSGKYVVAIRWRYTVRAKLLEGILEDASLNAIESHVDVYDLAQDRWESIAHFAAPSGGIAWHPNGKDLIVVGAGHLWRIPLPKHLQSTPAPGYTEPQ